MPSIFEIAKTSFNVPPSAQEELQDYFVLKATKNTIEKEIASSPTQVMKKHGITYIPVFLSPLKPSNPCALLSYRRVQGYPFGYVLIKDFKERKHGKP